MLNEENLKVPLIKLKNLKPKCIFTIKDANNTELNKKVVVNDPFKYQFIYENENGESAICPYEKVIAIKEQQKRQSSIDEETIDLTVYCNFFF